MSPTYLRHSLWFQVKTLGDSFQWISDASVMDRRRTGDDVLTQFSTIPSVKYGTLRVVTSYVVSADGPDDHIRYFHRRQ